MTESFRLVSERLEQVYKGLGEMQSLAAGVGDLKKVLSNVKTRGILGEIQLDAILKEILSPEQYDTNVATRRGSSERVEFAVKLPADDGQYVYPSKSKRKRAISTTNTSIRPTRRNLPSCSCRLRGSMRRWSIAGLLKNCSGVIA